MLRRLMPGLLLIVGLVLASPATASAATPLVASGTWNTVFGGSSQCANVGATGISCSHGYSSLDLILGIDTCVNETRVAITPGPSVTVDNPCHAWLTGLTSGTGRALEGSAGVCQTSGLLTGALHFSDFVSSYPTVIVSIVNVGGHATFAGTNVNTAGVVVAKTEGTFELACGSPDGVFGAFAGTYEVF